jgi:predicted RNA-binding Zn-ribbon protein involved in translation (DUF1610 family)
MIEGICKRESLHYKCPNCGEFSSSLTHIEVGQTFGPWYCSDCGRGYVGKRITHTEVDLNTYLRQCIKTLVLLRNDDGLDLTMLEAHSVEVAEYKPVFVIVEGIHVIDNDKEELRFDGDQYFYEEHSCPTNFMKVECFIQGDDADPHGIWLWVETIVKPNDYEQRMKSINCSEDRLFYFRSLFKSLNVEVPSNEIIRE